MLQLDPPRPFGPYLLVRRLAAGGMAEVYLAKVRGRAGFEKPVALKRIHGWAEADTGRGTLIDEAKLSASLCHPNIVQTFDLSLVEGSYVLVMEHVEGCDLHQVCDALGAANRAFPIDLAAHIVADVCSALDYAHHAVDDRGRPARLVHRDVSPQNVLLSRAGDVKLADFGIARTRSRQSDPELRVIKGKYFYMSPEQVRAGPLDHRSDVFSAGIVLWELLAGRRLYASTDIGSVLREARRALVPAPSTLRPEVPPELDAIVARATARDPDARYPDAASMERALRGYLDRRPLLHASEQIRELVAWLFSGPTALVDRSPSNLPQTRDRVPVSSAPPVAEPASGDDVDASGPTVSGRRSPPTSANVGRQLLWLAAAAGAMGLLWRWLYGM